MATQNSIDTSKPIGVDDGGTGVTTLTDHGVLVGSGTGAITVLGVATDGQIPIGSSGSDPVLANITSTDSSITVTNGAGTLDLAVNGAFSDSFVTDSGTATPAAGVLTVEGGNSIITIASASTLVVHLDSFITGTTAHIFSPGGSIGTVTGVNDQLFLQAYDIDGASYTTFATLTANNTPTMDLSDDVTKANNYIYRADGTDVPVTDGGTGVSTLTDHGLILGSGTSAVTSLGVATDGQFPIGSTGADPVLGNIASADSSITVSNGSGAIDLAVNGAFSDSFVTDSGTATPAASALTVAGGNNVSTSGAGSTVTVDLDGNVADSFPTDSGTATPALGVLTISGGTNINTSGSGSTVTVNLDSDLSDSVTKGGGYIYRGGGTDVPVTDGGTGVSTLTDHGVLVGSGTSAVTPISVGSTGTLLVGSTSSDPAFATSAVGDFTFSRSTAGDRVLAVSNTDNTTATSDARLDITTGGSSGGDAQVKYAVSGAGTFSTGIDNNDSDKFKISASSALGTTDVFECTTAGEITKPLQPAFGARANNQTNVTGDGTVYTVTFTADEYFDQNNDFDGTSTFTAPVTGLYQFNANVLFTEMQVAHTTAYIRLDTSNRDYITNHMDPFVARDGGNDLALQFSFLVDMDANDTARVQFLVSGSIKIIDIIGSQTYFNGYLVC